MTRALGAHCCCRVSRRRWERGHRVTWPNTRFAAAQAAGLKYIHLPFNAAMPDAKVVDGFLAAVGDTANQPVFIHCGSANRVGAVWMIKRALKDGWPIDRARAEAEAIGLTSPQLTAFATTYITAHR